MGKTGISWTDRTWNPTKGCSRTIAAGATQSGCGDGTGGGCYAEAQAGRIVRMAKGKPCAYDDLVRLTPNGYRWTGKVVLSPETLAAPLSWRKPQRVFVDSMSDLFHESLTNEQIAAVFGVMAASWWHTHQVLTKRATRAREWFAWAWEMAGRCIANVLALCLDEAAKVFAEHSIPIPTRPEPPTPITWPLPNVWLGVSVENQAAAEERVPELLATPAAMRFLSCEPLIGEVDLDKARCDDTNHGPDEWGVADDDATPWCNECDAELSYGHWLHPDGIGWVIAGCESGKAARSCAVGWLRLLRDQCALNGVPFFLKQAVSSAHAANDPHDRGLQRHGIIRAGEGSKRKSGGVIELPYLDGVQHAEFPSVDE